MNEIAYNKAPLWKRHFQRFINDPLAMIGIIIAFFIALACYLLPLMINIDPKMINMRAVNQSPNLKAWFGTDALGRDLLMRILYGGQVSIFIGIISSVMSAFIGTICGLIGGYFSGWIDRIFIRLSELIQTIPRTIVVMMIVSFLGNGMWNLIIIFIATGWMTVFRIVRNETIKIKNETFVSVSHVLGISHLRILFEEILPNIFSPIIVAITMNIPYFILAESGLSFLGLGVPTSIPTWGTIISDIDSLQIIESQWWQWIIPGSVLGLFCISMNFLGDGIRNVLDVKGD